MKSWHFSILGVWAGTWTLWQAGPDEKLPAALLTAALLAVGAVPARGKPGESGCPLL